MTTKAQRQKKTDSAATGGLSLETAKCDEVSTPEGVAIMAAISRLESGIHAKFDAHATEIRGKISLVREEMHNTFSSLKEDLKSQSERLTSLETATSEWMTSLHSLERTVASLQKEDIWRKASQGGQLKFRDKTVFVFPDFPPEIAKKRAA